MTATNDFYKAVNEQRNGVDGDTAVTMQFPRQLVNRMFYVLINMDDEESEFFAGQLRLAMQTAQSDQISIATGIVEHFIEYLKEHT